jgi:hypothetical protein
MNGDGLSPLLVALHYSDCASLAKTLLDSDSAAAGLTGVSRSESFSLVDVALHFGHVDVVKMLLSASVCACPSCVWRR